jgi:hypothetical protein
VIDNTCSNHAAIRNLEGTGPKWVKVSCITHGFALAMRNLCKFSRFHGRHSNE